MRDVTIKQHFGLDDWPEGYGDIGIEIEMEGTHLKYPPIHPVSGELTTPWIAKIDNSLKGEGLEYYLAKPIKRHEVRGALKALKQHWKDTGGKPQPTNQDAVHVHMNCRDLTLDKTMTFVMLLVMLEDVLVRWCGDEREGNLFCLRSRDAEAFLGFLRDLLIKKNFGSASSFSQQYLKYAAINVAPLSFFGSVEVRCMQTPKDIMIVDTWVEMLCSVYDAAMKLGCVRDVVDVLSYSMAEDLLAQIFGDNAHHLMVPDVDQLLFDGRERVKQVIYSAHIFKERKKNKTLIAPPPKPVKNDWQAQVFASLGSGQTLTPNAPVQPAVPYATWEGASVYVYASGFVPDSMLVGTVTGTKVKKYKLSPSLYFYKTIDGAMYSSNKNLTKAYLLAMFGEAMCGVPSEAMPVDSPDLQPVITAATAAEQWWVDNLEPQGQPE
jgi:hypothetical protein